MLDLNSASDLLLPELVIDNVDSGPISSSFDISFKDLTERVVINTPPYRKSSNVAFHPLCIEQQDQKGIILSIGNHLKEQRVRIYITAYLDHSFAEFDPIYVSDLIASEINQYLQFPITDNRISQLTIEKNISKLIENVSNIPLCNDISTMIVYDINAFIVEALNSYINTVYARYQKNPNGHNTASISSYLRDNLSNQVTMYVEKCPSNVQQAILEADSEDKIILPLSCAGIALYNNVYVAQNDGPQSHDSGRVVHKYISTTIVNRRLVSNDPIIPFSRLQATSPYCRNIFQNRMQVRRACTTQNLDLTSNDALVISERTKELAVPGMTLHVAFFQWGFTLEDGIIISRSAAEKMTGYKIHVDTFEVDIQDMGNTSLDISAIEEKDIDKVIRNYRQYFKYNPMCRFRRKGKLATTPKGIVRTTAKIPGIVFDIQMDEYEYQTNTGNGSIISKRITFVIKSLLRYKLDIGDKMAGYYHGNKGTVARIIEDTSMPTINGERVDVVMDPSICKRGIPSVVFECHDSMIAKKNNKPIYIDCMNTYERDTSICYGPLHFDEADTLNAVNDIMETLTDKNRVLHGFIRMSRLDHNSVEKLTYANRVHIGPSGKHNPGAITLPGIQHVLYAKGCNKALKEVMNDNGIVDHINNYLHVFGREMKDFINIKEDGNVP